MKKILFRADAKSSIGTGDLVSLLNLSKYFEKAGWETYFIVKKHKAAMGCLDKRRVKNFLVLDDDITIKNEVGRINDYIEANNIDVIMLEITEKKPSEYNGITDKVMIACVSFFGDIPEKTRLVINWDVDAGRTFDVRKYPSTRFLLGPQYVILPIEFDFDRINARAYKEKPETLLIVMGGADEFNLTQKVADTVALKDVGLKLRIAVGSGYEYLDGLLASTRKISCSSAVLENIDNMFEEFMGCDAAIGAGGLTVFELVASRTPSFIVAAYEHQIARCAYFDKMGWVAYLGFRGFDKSAFLKELSGKGKIPPKNVFRTEEIRKAVDELLERR